MSGAPGCSSGTPTSSGSISGSASSGCCAGLPTAPSSDRKSTRLNSSHTEIYTLSLHDALPIDVWRAGVQLWDADLFWLNIRVSFERVLRGFAYGAFIRSEEHTSELQSHRDLHSFPTRRSSDRCLARRGAALGRRPLLAQYPGQLRAGAARVCLRRLH